MKNTTLILLATAALLLAGCGNEEESFSRYPSVSVPSYGPEDYIPDLSSPDPERVYNAICNLGSSARQFGKTLCAEDADPASSEYQLAQEAYRVICANLESEEPLTVAVSLRFLKLFAKEYNPKEELVEIACQIKSDHPQVQFEQVALLKTGAEESTRLPEPLLRRLLDSSSWIVSRSTYGLIGRLEDEPLRDKLLQRYLDTQKEQEHLILIQALGHGLKSKEARLFEAQMLATQSPKIRGEISGVLVENMDQPAIKSWLIDHYQQLGSPAKERVFMSCMDEPPNDDIALACRLLSEGLYILADEFLEDLAEEFLDPTDVPEAELLRLEQALLAQPEQAVRWRAAKEVAVREHNQEMAIQAEMAPIAREFMETTKALLEKHGMPEDDQKELMKTIGSALSPVAGENMEQEE